MGSVEGGKKSRDGVIELVGERKKREMTLAEIMSDVDRRIESVKGKIAAVEFRAETDQQVDELIWRLWNYNRDNCKSASSDHHCKQIRKMIWAIVEPIQRDAEKLTERMAAAEDALKSVRKDLKNTKRREKRAADALESRGDDLANMRKKRDHFQHAVKKERERTRELNEKIARIYNRVEMVITEILHQHLKTKHQCGDGFCGSCDQTAKMSAGHWAYQIQSDVEKGRAETDV